MRLLFFDGASKCHQDIDGNIYTGANLADDIIRRYRRYCDELAVMLIEDSRRYSGSETVYDCNVVDPSLAEIISVPDLYNPRRNFLSLSVRKKIIDVMTEEILRADRVIIRAPGRFYTNAAIRLCRKYRRPYLIEAVDFVFEFLIHSRLKKIFAPYCELMCRREIAQAPYVVYVTQKALQKRYPSSGKTLGCSDIELPESMFVSRIVGGGKE